MMGESYMPGARPTRMPFRVLAGVIAGFILLVGLPASLWEAQVMNWQTWFITVCCFYGGIGLALAAWTGKWYGN